MTWLHFARKTIRFACLLLLLTVWHENGKVWWHFEIIEEKKELTTNTFCIAELSLRLSILMFYFSLCKSLVNQHNENFSSNSNDHDQDIIYFDFFRDTIHGSYVPMAPRFIRSAILWTTFLLPCLYLVEASLRIWWHHPHRIDCETKGVQHEVSFLQFSCHDFIILRIGEKWRDIYKN